MHERAMIRRGLFGLALTTIVLLGGTHSATALAEPSGDLTGTWTLTVAPQPKPPEVPVPPPPFTALFSFAEGGTITQTDTALHPAGSVFITPDLGPFGASDGLGAWKRTDHNRFTGRFVKILFRDGEQAGWVITRLKIAVREDTIELRGDSSIVIGPHPDAPPVFSGGITLAKGTRLPAR